MGYIRRDCGDGNPGARFGRPEEVAPLVTGYTAAIKSANRWAKRSLLRIRSYNCGRSEV